MSDTGQMGPDSVDYTGDRTFSEEGNKVLSQRWSKLVCGGWAAV